MVVWAKRIFGALLLFGVGQTKCSQYDPHLYPTTGPFFEGWYIRIVDLNQNQSFGVLFGRVLPPDDRPRSDTEAPPAIVTILNREGPVGSPLKSYNAFLTADQIHVSVNNGQPVTHDPDFRSPADFTWRADSIGSLRVRPASAEFNFTVNEWRFSANIGAPVPWDANGYGPEGFLLARLPLPLHWFVYSLRSPVLQYSLVNLKTQVSVTGSGVAHMEKNWGSSFPRAWIWVEGTTSRNVSLAMSGGLVTFFNVSAFTVPAYLVGYRNPDLQLTLNFRPVNALFSLSHDGCAGRITLEVNSLWYKFTVDVSGPPGSFSDCLYAPVSSGFVRLCEESYDSVATVVVKNRFGGDVVDRQVIHNTALEFGGDYVCGNRCRRGI